jgi:hypothetical protein
MPYPYTTQRSYPARQAVRSKLRTLRNIGEPDPDRCEFVYLGALNAGCQVGCNYDVDCQQACLRDAAVEFPSELFCPRDPGPDPDPPGPDPDPCGDCKAQCYANFEQFANDNCQQACDGGWDWDNPECASCLELGECRWAKCLALDCEAPCAGDPSIPGIPDEPVDPDEPIDPNDPDGLRSGYRVRTLRSAARGLSLRARAFGRPGVASVRAGAYGAYGASRGLGPRVVGRSYGRR